MRSLTSTWINPEGTDLIFMAKGSTSKRTTLSAHAVLLIIVAPDPHPCTLSYEEKAFIFFSERFPCLLLFFFFLKLLFWMFPVLYGTSNYCWLCTEVGIFFLFFSRLLSCRWQDKNWNVQLNWQNWRHFVLILSFMYGKNIHTFISHSVSLCAEKILTSSDATAYKPL